MKAVRACAEAEASVYPGSPRERSRRDSDVERLVRRRTRHLEEALRRSTLLLHEADHRVKNNLQMISAMLLIQRASAPDAGVQAALQDMVERVDAVGLVHQRLQDATNSDSVDIGDLIREIATNLVTAAGREDIALVLAVESAMIGPDAAAPVALVINETVTNALKHAFPPGRGGALRIDVRRGPGSCEISVRDDGTGMPGGDRPRSGFGTTLIEAMVRQVRATIEWLPALPGTHVRITLPLPDLAPARV